MFCHHRCRSYYLVLAICSSSCCWLLDVQRALAFSFSPITTVARFPSNNNYGNRIHDVDRKSTRTTTSHSRLPLTPRKAATKEEENVAQYYMSLFDSSAAPQNNPKEIETTPTLTPSERKEKLRQLRRVILARRRRAITDQEDEVRDQQDVYFLLEAIVPSILAFFLWDDISYALSVYIADHSILGSVPYDVGSQFSNNLLRPTITGVVVPVIAIGLATLVSTTVNVLRERQVELRALVNKEACDLRLLRRAIFGMFGTRQHAWRRARALGLLGGYVDQLNRECHPGAIDSLEELELSGGIATNELDRLSAMMHGVDGAAVSRQNSVEVADDILARLNQYRSDRVALLLTDFPDLHWIVLTALSVSIIVTFLLESNQLAGQYLDSIQLRSLFALLVGVFSATATLMLNLDDPFTGSFSIIKASMQIGDLQLCLQEDVREANAEVGEISSTARKFFWSFFDAPTAGGAASNSIRGKIQTRNNLIGLGGGGVGSSAKSASSSMSTTTTSPSGNSNNGDASATSTTKDTTPTDTVGDNGLFETETERGRSRYGILSTIYWHLLTSPMASSVRALGDVAAWIVTPILKRARRLLSYVTEMRIVMKQERWYRFLEERRRNR